MLALLSLSGNLLQGLKQLELTSCSKLETIADSLDNSTSLQVITVLRCKNLKTLPDGLHKLSNLQAFTICKNLVSFPKGGLPSTKLRDLDITSCQKLEALPNGLHNLTSLQHLKLGNLPSVVSFPEDGFPINLDSLEIKERNICKALFEWGLHRFSSSKQLKIDGGCDDVVSFPQVEVGMTLPVSLTKLEIINFQNLERLSSAFEDLTSLECLRLFDCPKLKYFPEKNGLPTSFLQLDISGCPLIEERCRKDQGQYWHLLTNVAYISINFRIVIDWQTDDDDE